MGAEIFENGIFFCVSNAYDSERTGLGHAVSSHYDYLENFPELMVAMWTFVSFQHLFFPREYALLSLMFSCLSSLTARNSSYYKQLLIFRNLCNVAAVKWQKKRRVTIEITLSSTWIIRDRGDDKTEIGNKEGNHSVSYVSWLSFFFFCPSLDSSIVSYPFYPLMHLFAASLAAMSR